MSKHSATDKNIRLRKWCLEYAMRATGISATAEWMIGQAQQLYDWVTSTSRQPDQKFGEQLRK